MTEQEIQKALHKFFLREEKFVIEHSESKTDYEAGFVAGVNSTLKNLRRDLSAKN